MEAKPDQPPLIVIVGETASGKTALAIELAQQFNGEVIAADSRTVYRGMDIGTAKPGPDERRIAPHHLIDIVTPNQPFTVADFKKLASQAIDEIAARGRMPFLVGGTGLYVDAILYDFKFRAKPDKAQRKKLQALSVAQLQSLLQERAIPLPPNDRNPHHLIRSLESGGIVPKQNVLRPNTLIIGLTVGREDLKNRIRRRIEHMIEQGFINEVRHLVDRFGPNVPALQAPGYKAFWPYIEDKVTLKEAVTRCIQLELQLAKRQRTWFKRNGSIHWVVDKKKAVALITAFLNK